MKNEDEYKEMLEFTAQAAAQLKDLPPNPRREKLVADAESLAALVAAKAGAAAVADAAGKLRRALIEAYGVRVAPQRTPDLAAGAKLYALHCAACHGAQGRGDGPAAKGLEPGVPDRTAPSRTSRDRRRRTCWWTSPARTASFSKASPRWAMTLVSFFAVYREMFETVLFYQALWVQAGESGRGAFLAGVGAAVAMLAAIGWGIFRYGVRLPLGPFFAVTSVLLCALAVVLAGKGIAALQEAGVIPADLVDAVPAVPWLGVFPTWQTLGAQAIVLVIVVAAFAAARRTKAGPV